MRDETKNLLTSGMFAGLLGYLTVVVLFALLNLAMGHSPFHTPAMFGAVLFYGLEDPAALEMVHVLAFVALGVLASWLVTKAEEYPVARYAILVLLVFVAAHIYAALLLFAQPLLAGSGWWQIGVVSLAAAVAMGWYLVRQHPVLKRGLRETPLGDEEE
jgi:hypothetical protein